MISWTIWWEPRRRASTSRWPRTTTFRGCARRATRRTCGVCSVRPPAPLMTYVTCPVFRHHPAIVAQKAATVQLLSGGRFRLGLGSGENPNEHVVGGGWPSVDVCHKMLEEAVEIIRALFAGGRANRRGPHFDVESARPWDLPAEPPPIPRPGSSPRTTWPPPSPAGTTRTTSSRPYGRTPRPGSTRSPWSRSAASRSRTTWLVPQDPAAGAAPRARLIFDGAANPGQWVDIGCRSLPTQFGSLQECPP